MLESEKMEGHYYIKEFWMFQGGWVQGGSVVQQDVDSHTQVLFHCYLGNNPHLCLRSHSDVFAMRDILVE